MVKTRTDKGPPTTRTRFKSLWSQKPTFTLAALLGLTLGQAMAQEEQGPAATGGCSFETTRVGKVSLEQAQGCMNSDAVFQATGHLTDCRNASCKSLFDDQGKSYFTYNNTLIIDENWNSDSAGYYVTEVVGQCADSLLALFDPLTLR